MERLNYKPVNITFPISYNKIFSAVSGCPEDSGVWPNIEITSNTIKVSARGTNSYSNSEIWFFALGIQQWGYTGNRSNKITFPLRYPKAVLGIMITTGDGIPQNPVDVTLSGATASSYSGTGYTTYWLAYGIQQWGYTEKNTVTLPIAYTKYCCVATSVSWGYTGVEIENLKALILKDTHSVNSWQYITVGIQRSGDITPCLMLLQL